MTDISGFLNAARERSIIDNRTHAALDGLRAELAGETVSDDARSAMAMETAPQAESEAPRFIRGFHDILITIGILIALGGLWVLGSAIVVIPAIIILAEIFVKRQRLALPAFVLTIALTVASGAAIGALVRMEATANGIFLFGAQALALAAFYWRYRVPVALASLILAGFGLAFMLILSAIGSDPTRVFEDNARLIGAIGLVLTLGLFAVAMRYDLKDPARISRNSDIAFWLHLTTAPLLIYSTLVVLFGEDGFWWADRPQISEAMAAIGIVTIMILIGIIIDRRAFVTSGLISLGAALGIITRETGVDISSVTAFVLLAVGIIVLLLGAGWQKLRSFVLGAVPDHWRGKLPPAAE